MPLPLKKYANEFLSRIAPLPTRLTAVKRRQGLPHRFSISPVTLCSQMGSTCENVEFIGSQERVQFTQGIKLLAIEQLQKSAYTSG